MPIVKAGLSQSQVLALLTDYVKTTDFDDHGLEVAYSPTNYTPTTGGKLENHLAGLNTKVGTIAAATDANTSVSYSPSNYTPTAGGKLSNHLAGINTKLGEIVQQTEWYWLHGENFILSGNVFTVLASGAKFGQLWYQNAAANNNSTLSKIFNLAAGSYNLTVETANDNSRGILQVFTRAEDNTDTQIGTDWDMYDATVGGVLASHTFSFVLASPTVLRFKTYINGKNGLSNNYIFLAGLWRLTKTA